MLGEVPCEDVVGPRLPRLSDKGPAVGKGPPRDVLIGHFWRAWPRISRAFYLEQWLDLGFQKGLSDSGAQNLDRFQPLLEGGRPVLAGGLALTVRRGEADLGFQKGVGHSWQEGLAPDCLARRSRFGVSEGPQRLGGPEP